MGMPQSSESAQVHCRRSSFGVVVGNRQILLCSKTSPVIHWRRHDSASVIPLFLPFLYTAAELQNWLGSCRGRYPLPYVFGKACSPWWSVSSLNGWPQRYTCQCSMVHRDAKLTAHRLSTSFPAPSVFLTQNRLWRMHPSHWRKTGPRLCPEASILTVTGNAMSNVQKAGQVRISFPVPLEVSCTCRLHWKGSFCGTAWRASTSSVWFLRNIAYYPVILRNNLGVQWSVGAGASGINFALSCRDRTLCLQTVWPTKDSLFTPKMHLSFSFNPMSRMQCSTLCRFCVCLYPGRFAIYNNVIQVV